jgi:hypothetical protein
VTLSGADAGNYTVTIPSSALADIFQKALSASVVANDKIYDGTMAATGSVTLAGVVAGDSVAPSGGTFAFADKNAGTDKPVTVSAIALTGADAGNYTVTFPASVVADILPKAVVANVVASGKTYDGSTATAGTVTLDGVIAGDAVGTTDGSLAFVDPNAGAGKTVTVSGVALTGADAGNYTLTVPASVAADILQRAITVTANGATKDSGERDPVLTYAVTDGSLVAGDSLTGSLAREAGEEPGDYAIIQGSLAASANYLLTFVGNLLTIEAAPIVVGDLDGYLEHASSNGLIETDEPPLLQVSEEETCGDGAAGEAACTAAGGDAPAGEEPARGHEPVASLQ